MKSTQTMLDILRGVSLGGSRDEVLDRLLREAVTERIKTEVDRISRQLMNLRLQKKDESNQEMIQELAGHRLVLRRLGWRSSFDDLTGEEQQALNTLIPLAKKDHEAVLRDAKRQLKMLKSARRFRSLVKAMDLAVVISLHLSSHGDGLGAFNQGFLYPLKPTINRVAQQV
jgi:hypothetical protein